MSEKNETLENEEERAVSRGVTPVSKETLERAKEEVDHPPKERKRRTRSPEGQAVTGKVDPVVLARAEYRSRKTRKSLTVHHIQRRLIELGYPLADADPDGWYSDYTKDAVAAFQRDQLIEPADGIMTAETFESLFENDPNVEIRVSA